MVLVVSGKSSGVNGLDYLGFSAVAVFGDGVRSYVDGRAAPVITRHDD